MIWRGNRVKQESSPDPNVEVIRHAAAVVLGDPAAVAQFAASIREEN